MPDYRRVARRVKMILFVGLQNAQPYRIQAGFGSWFRSQEGFKFSAGIFSAIGTGFKLLLSCALANKAVPAC